MSAKRITLPAWVHKVIGPVVALLPDQILARVLGSTVPFTSDELPPLPAVPDGFARLYIAPVNFAGQGMLWAQAAERYGHDVGAVSMAYQVAGQFEFPVDCLVPSATYIWSRAWQRRQAAYLLGNFTHVLVEAEQVLFSGLYRGTVRSEINELRKAGVRTAMLCHGSDIRLPSRHAATHEDSPFRSGLWDVTPTLEKQARRNIRLLETLGQPIFVSTPDLLVDVPSATWLPVVVDPARWSVDAGPSWTDAPPVVAHVPSRAIVKGSDLIDPIMQRLDDEGIVRYRRVEGVAAAAMPEIYREADIVLDQFRIGSYGVAACEAMAAGRLVVSHVDEQVRQYVRDITGHELPIVEATASTLETVLREMIADPASFLPLARDGVTFVNEVHSGRMSAESLNPFLSSAL